MIQRVGIAAAVAATFVGTAALAQSPVRGIGVQPGRAATPVARGVGNRPVLPQAPVVDPATGTFIRPGFPPVVNGNGFLQTNGNRGAQGGVVGGSGAGINNNGAGINNNGAIIAPSTAGGGQIGNPFSPAGAGHITTGVGPIGAGTNVGPGVNTNPTAVSPGLQVDPNFGNGFFGNGVFQGTGAVVPLANGLTGVVMQNPQGQQVIVVQPHAGSRAFGTLRATDKIRFATDMTLEARMGDIRKQQAGDVRVGGVRTAPPAVGDTLGDGDLRVENRGNRNTQPRSLVAGERQESRQQASPNDPNGDGRADIVGDINYSSADTQQLRVSAKAEDLMENRPMREGEIVRIGATGVVVRYDTETRSRMDTFNHDQVFFFQNGRMLTAANAGTRLTVGSRVLVPSAAETTAIRQSVAGSRQEIGGSTSVRSRTAGSRQSRRRLAK